MITVEVIKVHIYIISAYICLRYPVKPFALGLLTKDIHSFFFFVPAGILRFTFAFRGAVRESVPGT